MRRLLVLVLLVVAAVAARSPAATAQPAQLWTTHRYDAAWDNAPTLRLSPVSATRPDRSERAKSTSFGTASLAPAALVVATEAGGGLPPLRQAYVSKVGSISDNVAAWKKAGADPEFIAREAWADRRAIGIEYKGQTPPEVLEQISARNIARYGDPLGPTIDWLRAQGKTWEQIIESATRSGGQDLGF